MKSIQILIFMLLALAVAAAAQNQVRDTSGKPLRRGANYFIKPAIADHGGRFTLVDRNSSCPLYVGQENTAFGKGLPVTFAPYLEKKNVVREGRDFTVWFAATTRCEQSTMWQLEGELIGTGDDDGYTNYFHIIPGQVENTYFIEWCPRDLCRACRFRCGKVGALFENGKTLLALAGRSVLPVVFERAYH